MYVVKPTTMKRIVRKFTGMKRVEKNATITLCQAADKWIERIVARIVTIATDKDLKTIDVATVEKALENEVPVERSLCNEYIWCKTRHRDRIKSLSKEFRWGLKAKITLWNHFDAYLMLLARRIRSSQRLAKRRTIAHSHVLASIEYR